MTSSRQVRRSGSAIRYDQPAHFETGVAHGAQSAGGYFTFDTVGSGWIIRPDLRDSLTLPNFILANASEAMVAAFESLISSGPTGAESFRAFVAAAGIKQVNPPETLEDGEVIPGDSRDDTAGTTIIVDFRALNQQKGGYLGRREEIASTSVPGAEASGFAELFKDDDEPVEITRRFDLEDLYVGLR